MEARNWGKYGCYPYRLSKVSVFLNKTLSTTSFNFQSADPTREQEIGEWVHAGMSSFSLITDKPF